MSALYIFSADGLAVSDTGDAVALDRSPSKNNLQLRSNPPQWVYSYAPLVSKSIAVHGLTFLQSCMTV